VYFEKSVIEHLYELIKDLAIVAIVPLHCCTNWHRNIIDNTNCSHWGLNAFWSESRPASLIFNDVCLIESCNDINEHAKLLINNLNFVLTTVFHNISINLKKFEYKFPEKISLLFADDPWVRTAIDTEIKYFEIYKNIYNTNLKEILAFTKNFDINQSDYCDKLDQKIKQHCWQGKQVFLVGNIRV
jgi:hypothetical protein